jgi:hypothetical protein
LFDDDLHEIDFVWSRAREHHEQRREPHLVLFRADVQLCAEMSLVGLASCEHCVVLGQKLWIGEMKTQDIADGAQNFPYGVWVAQEVHEFRYEDLQNLFLKVSGALLKFSQKRYGIGLHVRLVLLKEGLEVET